MEGPGGSLKSPPGPHRLPPTPQVHGDDPLAPPRLPLHIPLREHVEHRQHLQHEHGHGRGRWVPGGSEGGFCSVSDAKTCGGGGAGYGIMERGGVLTPCSLPPLPPPGAGMPAAYDLSSVIAGGSNVGHNNLIPLGERELGGSRSWKTGSWSQKGGSQHPQPSPLSPPSAANTGIVNHTHSRMGSIMSTGIVQGNAPPQHTPIFPPWEPP